MMENTNSAKLNQHVCAYYHEVVPNIWNRLTFAEILDTENINSTNRNTYDSSIYG